MEQGALDDAVAAYQRMMDEKPDAHAYGRAAHVRFLKGDTAGALEAMKIAARATSPRNAESFAWMRTRLAFYQLHAGMPEASRESCREALAVQPDSTQARYWMGRAWLAEGAAERAVASLEEAAARTDLPDVLWSLARGAAPGGAVERAARVEARILERGQRADPRGFAVYLASTGRSGAAGAIAGARGSSRCVATSTRGTRSPGRPPPKATGTRPGSTCSARSRRGPPTRASSITPPSSPGAPGTTTRWRTGSRRPSRGSRCCCRPSAQALAGLRASDG